MTAHGTSVWTGRALQARFEDLEVIGLALLYPALEWNVCVPGHHGYPRASDLILGKALKAGRATRSRTRRRDRFSISLIQLADLGRNSLVLSPARDQPKPSPF